MHQFSGSTIEEALQQATAELGRDITVVRARRVTSKRTLGFGSKVRFEVDVMAGAQAAALSDNSAPTGEFDGVLASLIDNIERLEADQGSRAGGARPSFETAAADTERSRFGFGDADLAAGPIGYGPAKRRAAADARADARGADGRAGIDPSIDLRPLRSEVDDDVLASMLDRPASRPGPDSTPPRARLARTVPDQGQGGTNRAVRQVPPSAPDTTPLSGDPLARAARRAAERAALERSGQLAARRATPQPVDVDLEAMLAERIAAERLAAEALLNQRLEAERLEAERLEVQRLEAERLEQARIDAERQTAERLEAERAEAERQAAARAEADRLEAARIEAERAEAARLEAERLEAERQEAERLEAERVEAERAEAARREAERLEAERREAERLEAERLEAERLEAERLEAERLEAQRLAEEARVRREAEEADRRAAMERQLAAEKALVERLEAERLEVERLRTEQQAEERRLAAEREAERLRELRRAAEEHARLELERQREEERIAEAARQAEFEQRERERRAAAEAARLERLAEERAEAERQAAAAHRAAQQAEAARQLEREREMAEAFLAAHEHRSATTATIATTAPRHEVVEADWVDIDDPGHGARFEAGERSLPMIDAEVGELGTDDYDDAAEAPVGSGRRARRRLRNLQRAIEVSRPVRTEIDRSSAGLTVTDRHEASSESEVRPAGHAAGGAVATATTTSVELALPNVAPESLPAKRSAGLLSTVSSTRPARRNSAPATGEASLVLDENGATVDLTLGGEPQWSLEHLAAVGVPSVAVEALSDLELETDADWMSAMELFIREHVPAPVSRPSETPGVFLSGSGRESAAAIVQAGLLGFRPGYIFVDGQLRLASSIELMLAIRSCLPR